MKNPYRLYKNNEFMVGDAIMTAIFPFAPISYGIDVDKKILKPRNAHLKERLGNCGITISAKIIQLTTYYYVYDIYSIIHKVLR